MIRRRQTPPTPEEAARSLRLVTDDVWRLIVDDDRLDVIQAGARKLIVPADNSE